MEKAPDDLKNQSSQLKVGKEGLESDSVQMKTLAPPVPLIHPTQMKEEQDEETIQGKINPKLEEDILQKKGEEEEELTQLKEEEEEEIQLKEDEEEVQLKEDQEIQLKQSEEEATQLKQEEAAQEAAIVNTIQRKREEEEELSQLKKEDEEETLQQKTEGPEGPVQMQEEEEEEIQLKQEEEEEATQLKAEPETETIQQKEPPIVLQQKQEHSPFTVQMKSTEEPVQKMEDRGSFNGPGGGGSSSGMPEDVQTKMESSFGRDFSDVNIHQNSKTAEDIGALAYTQGKDIHFKQGQYNPNSQSGQELLGHELTHVIQQENGVVKPNTQAKGIPVNDEKHLEKEADDMGAKAARGEKVNMNVTQQKSIDNNAAQAKTPATQLKSADPPPFIPQVQAPVQKKESDEDEETAQKKEKEAENFVHDGGGIGEDPPGNRNAQPFLVAQQKEAAYPSFKPFQLRQNPLVQKAEAGGEEAAPEAPGTVVNLSHGFNPPEEVAAYLDANHKKYVSINARIGNVGRGQIEVRQKSKARGERPASYQIKSGQGLALTLPGFNFLAPLAQHGITPVIALNAQDPNNISAFLSVKVGDKVLPDPRDLINTVNTHMAALGLLGVDPLPVPDYTNHVVEGVLSLMTPMMNTQIGGFMNAQMQFGLVDGKFIFTLHGDIEVEGLASGIMNIERNEEGQYHGEANVDVTIQNVNGNIIMIYANGEISGTGTATFESEKFNGSLTLILDSAENANAAVHEGLGIETVGGEEGGGEGAEAANPTPGPRVLAGFGSVTMAVTPWLEATANVGIDSKGHVTVHGELVFPDEIELMEQKDVKKDLFDHEIKLGYGVPLVGQVFLFIGIGAFLKAGFGPLVLKDIGMEGTYSTDPNVLQNFKITGALGISAYAQAGLTASAGVGLTLLGHDIKAGLAVDAAAGLQAYAEARPTFEYTESSGPGGKEGEARLKGHFEAAAALFLDLAGRFFVELDSPWWSPAPDKTWEWPFGSVEYPLGGSLGIGADVDWLVGSSDVPEINFSPVDFDPDKFISDMTKDPENAGGSGETESEQEGTWKGDGDSSQQAEPELSTQPKGEVVEEDLSRLSDDEKYMRALGEIGEMAEAANDQPTTSSVLAKRLKAIKSKYGIATARIQGRKKDSVKIYVAHGGQDNSKNLIECKIITQRERDKQFKAAQDDLEKMIKNFEHPETGAVTKSQLQTAAHEVDIAHDIIVATLVRDLGDTWAAVGDIEDSWRNMVKRPKAELAGLEDENDSTSAETTSNAPTEAGNIESTEGGQEREEKEDEPTMEEKEATLDKALEDAEKIGKDTSLSIEDIEKALPRIKRSYGLQWIKLKVDNIKEEETTIHFEAKINPEDKSDRIIRKAEGEGESEAEGPDRSGPDWRPVRGLYFTQDSCSNNSSGGYTVRGNAAKLRSEPNWDIPAPVEIFRKDSSMNKWPPQTTRYGVADMNNLKDGDWYSLDNRRLLAYKMGRTRGKIQTVMVSKSRVREKMWHCTTPNQGRFCKLNS